MPRAFALASVLFYVALRGGGLPPRRCWSTRDGRVGARRGLYAAFAPAWVTHYSLSNDGNYVEVLAFGTWALLLAARWIDEAEHRRPARPRLGLLLGLAFWCHILAVIHAAAVAVRPARLRPARVLPARCRPWSASFGAGYLPGLLWNAGNDWFSLGYLLTGAHQDRPVDCLGLRIADPAHGHRPLADPAGLRRVAHTGPPRRAVARPGLGRRRCRWPPPSRWWPSGRAGDRAGALTVLLVFTGSEPGSGPRRR